MKRNYRIGDFNFAIEMEEGIEPPENFKKFAINAAGDFGSGESTASEECGVSVSPEYEYQIMLADTLPEPGGSILMNGESLRVWDNGVGESRQIFMAGEGEPYAYYEEVDGSRAKIWFRQSRLSELCYDTVFVSLLALERRMLKRGGLILHCSYSIYNGEAILFSAPSGTGKSTQADLWQKYRGSRVINGDRCLLQKSGDKWMAKAWPICGSSEICHLEEAPIRGVTMLSQGPKNVVSALSGAKAFSQIYGQITVNRWNREAGIAAMDLLEDFLREVPMYHLSCTISEEAVECLAKEMGL